MSETIILAVLGGLTTAVAVLWARSERLISDRTRMDLRFTRLLARLAACPVLGCPFRTWSHEELDDDDGAETPPCPRP